MAKCSWWIESLIRVIKCGGLIDSYSRDYSIYSRRGERQDYSETMQKAFDRLNRKDIESIYGPNLIECRERLYLTHVLTAPELVACADRDQTFLRLHVGKLPKDYFHKFRDTDTFRNTVGDRRNRSNDAFGKALETRLQELA